MADFATAYALTNTREGGMVLSTAASDRGGMTYGGIARARQPGGQWAGWQLIDRLLARGRGFKPSPSEETLLQDLHRTFFRLFFWDDLHGGDLPDQDIAEKVYDAAVNCSRTSAVRWLQAALNVSNQRGRLWADVRIDGGIGPATVAAVESACANAERKWLVLQTMETQQEDHYFQLALRDDTQEANLLGWYRQRIQHRVAPPRG